MRSVYYESGFNIQLLSNALIIFNKAGHIKEWSYNFKKPMACFDSPSGKQNIRESFLGRVWLTMP